MWTAAEVNSAIVCSCLPAIRALFKTGRKVTSKAPFKRRSLTSSRGTKSKSSQPEDSTIIAVEKSFSVQAEDEFFRRDGKDMDLNQKDGDGGGGGGHLGLRDLDRISEEGLYENHVPK